MITVYRKNAVDDVTGIRFGVSTSGVPAVVTARGQEHVPTSSQTTNTKGTDVSPLKGNISGVNTGPI